MSKKKPPDQLAGEPFRERIKLILGESDRGAVLVAGALIEEQLEIVLRGAFHFHDLPKKVCGDLFGFTGPLGNFSGKAKIARAFGVIKDATFRDIERIRDVRNKAAHVSTEFNFEAKGIRKKIEELTHFAAQMAKPGKSGKELTHKQVFSLCVGATYLEILGDFNAYARGQLKLSQPALSEFMTKQMGPLGAQLGLGSLGFGSIGSAPIGSAPIGGGIPRPGLLDPDFNPSEKKAE